MSYKEAYTATKWQRDTKAIKEQLFDMSLGNERGEITWFCDPLSTLAWGGIVLLQAGAILHWRDCARSHSVQSRAAPQPATTQKY
jgi:hypothetical protein